MIREYLAVFVPEKVGGYTVIFPTLRGCITQGETFEEAKLMAQEALELWLEVSDETDGHLDTSQAITARIQAHVPIVRKSPSNRAKTYVGAQRARG